MQTSGRHPEGLFVLFFTEMWERFSYYGMRAIFVLYMTKALMFDKAFASNIYGSYTGLVYLTPLIGGYIADRYWGNRRSILVGGLLMALGQFMMFFSASNYQNVGLAQTLMWIGLTGLIVGNGFFKPNISTLVGSLYPAGDKRVDAAFTLFYMGINLGAFFSPLVCGAIGDTGNPADFRWGFFAAGVGMVFGVLSFELLKRKYLVTPEGAPVGAAPKKRLEGPTPHTTVADMADEAIAQQKPTTPSRYIVPFGLLVALLLIFRFVGGQDWVGSSIFSVSIAAFVFVLMDPSLTKVEVQRIVVILIAAFFVIFFWAAFEQAGASLTFFADEQMNRTINLNTSMGVVYAIISALAFILYFVLNKIMSIPKEYKMLFGLIGAVLLGLTIWKFIQGEQLVMEEISAAAFNSVNAIFIVLLAPLFAEIWGALGRKGMEPPSPFKQALGLLFLSLGYLLIAFVVKDLAPGIKVSMFWLIALYFLHTVGELCLSPIGLSLVNKLAPVRFASLLMGAWFLANATANKFAGTLSSFYPEAGKTTSFMGYHMSNLYDFFMLFVVMSGVASIILFFLARMMVRLMNGIR
jgi:POT family proton-dependent oligopeptide transporter